MISLERLCKEKKDSTDKDQRGDTRNDLESTTISHQKLSAYRSKTSLVQDKLIHSIMSNRPSSSNPNGQNSSQKDSCIIDMSPSPYYFKRRKTTGLEKPKPFILAKGFSGLNQRKGSAYLPKKQILVSKSSYSINQSQISDHFVSPSHNKSKFAIYSEDEFTLKRPKSCKPPTKENDSEFLSEELISPTKVNARLCIPYLPEFNFEGKRGNPIFQPTVKAQIYEAASQETAVRLGMITGSTVYKPKKAFLKKEFSLFPARQRDKTLKQTGMELLHKELSTYLSVQKVKSHKIPQPSADIKQITVDPSVDLLSNSATRPQSGNLIPTPIYSPLFKLNIEEVDNLNEPVKTRPRGKILVRNLIQLSKLTKNHQSHLIAAEKS